MHLRITCPHCGNPLRLSEPFPLPGAERQCGCGRALAITYPVGMIDTLRGRGARFEAEASPPPRPSRPAVAPRAAWAAAPDLGGGSDAGAVRAAAEAETPRAKEPPREAPPDLLRRSVLPVSLPSSTPRRRWTRVLAWGALGAGVLGMAAVGGMFAWIGAQVPGVEQLATYRPPTVTEVYDAKGRLMGEIYEKRRYVVPLDQVPEHVRTAFIAAEDAAFRQHGGVDYAGIVRAVLRNAAQGKKAQGASTITQQVARNFLLSNEKTYTRKLKEVVLAWRIEEAFDKDHILYLYLNQIYLGSGAYGVEAASRVYFGKHVSEISLPEAAMLAGLPQRPSEYSPHRDFAAAKVRQKYVLQQMVDKGHLSAEDADRAYQAPIDIVDRTNEFLLKAPWFTEQVRRYLVATYGEERVLNDGLVVHSTCDLDLQQHAQDVVTRHVTELDGSRAGWRGAAEHLAEEQIAPRLEALARESEDLTEEQRYPAVVLEVTKTRAIVGLGGTRRGVVPLAWTIWAWTKGGPRKQDDLTRVLSRGDVVIVELVKRDTRDVPELERAPDMPTTPHAAVRVYQASEVQGALWSYRLTDGAVLAMVGGSDFKETKFNRAVQASRQVGSTFKPIVYAAAIESRRFTVATIVQDAPIIFNTLKQQLWKPENYGEDYMGDITLRNALALSRNVVTIRVLDAIGLEPVYQLARTVGLESPMDVDLAMGLGSASLKMPELARAYSVFATNGHKVDYHILDRVIDRDGKVLEQWTTPEWPLVMDASSAGVTSWLLQEVARSGTAARSQQLGLHVAGKTGTTNDFHDAWFVGYTPELMTAVWVGYDQPKSLGDKSTGGQVSLPIWMDYVRQAVPKEADRDFPAIPKVTWLPVDDATGRSVAGGRSMPFLEGTEPAGGTLEAGQVTTEDLLTTEF
jgi:penicillin-binding protein 1A